MIIVDIGIYLEIVGFLFLLFTVDRFSTGGGTALVETGSQTTPHKFHIIRRKIIPDRYVSIVFIFGISFIIFGLIFQLSC